jgi:hypothetical protein
MLGFGNIVFSIFVGNPLSILVIFANVFRVMLVWVAQILSLKQLW